MSGLFDSGLQPERTRLAWRRTLLSFVVGALLSLRVLPPLLGAWAGPVVLAGVVGALAMTAVVVRRFRRVDAALADGTPLPSGRALLAYALLVTGIGAAVLVAMIVHLM